MRTTIDAAGRIVVPKPLREQLGFAPGTELELEDVDGHLEVSVPSRVRIEEGSHGPVAVVDGPVEPLTDDIVLEIIERGRR
jgi:AbrB family looped-hinge helix DNA binding protein